VDGVETRTDGTPAITSSWTCHWISALVESGRGIPVGGSSGYPLPLHENPCYGVNAVQIQNEKRAEQMKHRTWRFQAAIFIVFQLAFALPLVAQNYAATDIALTPGTDASNLNLAWMTDQSSSDTCAVQIAPAGSGFKRQTTFTGKKVFKAADNNDADYYYCKVVVANLKSKLEYLYRVGDGKNWNGPYSYSTEDSGKFGFAFLSDAQIGASRNVPSDVAGWANTTKAIGKNFPGAAFILSSGDQVEVGGNTAQWDGFFSPAELRSIPVAPTPASHDEMGNGPGGGHSSYAFRYHFNLPNESAPSNGLAVGDYYFKYGKALFMVLNMDSNDFDAHRAFMKAAVEANPDAKWKIAMWHYTIYTAASRGMRPQNLRSSMVSIVDDLGIDVVLMGHDHTYCRTWQMLGDVPQTNLSKNSKGEVANPPGAFYLTADSASGSKYYPLGADITVSPDPSKNPRWYWVSTYLQLNVPTFSYFNVDDRSLKVSTYRTDTMAEIDTYTIFKDRDTKGHSSK
jgi:hypothetical protein